MLKKFLKNLPSFVPPDGGVSSSARAGSTDSSSDGEGGAEVDTAASEETDRRDESSEPGKEEKAPATEANPDQANTKTTATKMARNPGEVAFFRLLNSELRKAIRFFDKAQLEFEIRESRVREGIEIMRKANSLMVSEKWSLMAKSLYRLYKDLLLLETYAIMTYCSFSKILKKHDKVTSHNTRVAFMKNVVNKANFTHYPKLLGMISRCENLYEEVSRSLVQEGKLGLYEDERLFINMIHRLNEQVLDTAQEEGADINARKERRQNGSPAIHGSSGPASPTQGKVGGGSFSSQSQVSTLRSLVEENSINKSSKEGLARVQEQENMVANTVKAAEALAGMTADSSNMGNKRNIKPAAGTAKRARTE